MAQNKINDLRDHLFEVIERLKDPDEKEMTVEKAMAIKDVAQVIVNSAKVEVDFLKATDQHKTSSNLLKSITETASK
jgi:hypothetical protein